MLWSSRGLLYDDGAYMKQIVSNSLVHAKSYFNLNFDICGLTMPDLPQGTLDRNLYFLFQTDFCLVVVFYNSRLPV
jgi:hypothetical protein